MNTYSFLALGLTAALSAQATLVYDNGTWVTDSVAGTSLLQNAAPFLWNTLGFNVNNAANVRQTEEFTVQSGLVVDEIEVFFYNTNATAPTCTGVFVSLFNGNPATGTPTQLITGAGDTVNLIGAAGFTVSNTLTGTYRVTPQTLTNTARQIQSVRITLPAGALAPLTPGTYYLQWSFTGATTPFFPPITTLNTANTGNAQQYTAGVYAALVQNLAGPVPVPTATQGAPFRLYGSGGLPGAITALGGGCSMATIAVTGAPTIGGHMRVELGNTAQLALAAVIIGGASPGLPLGPCGCVLNASVDILDPNNFFELQIPVVSSLVGLTLYAQGAELDLAGIAGLPCNVGIGVALTDASSFRLNIN
jgi:hypothetical protein